MQQNQHPLLGLDVNMIDPFERDKRASELAFTTAVMTATREIWSGDWLTTLDDGSIWREIDSAPSPCLRTPRRIAVI